MAAIQARYMDWVVHGYKFKVCNVHQPLDAMLTYREGRIQFRYSGYLIRYEACGIKQRSAQESCYH